MNSYIEDIAAAFRTAPPLTRPASDRVLNCPVCAAPMAVERLYAVAVDVCPQHGAWFDAGEAQSLVQRVLSGERASAREAVAEARRKGKWSAIFFGIWSLFLNGE